MTEMPEFNVTIERPSSLEYVLTEWLKANGLTIDLTLPMYADLKARLYAREDNVADILRLAGDQFNMFPEIVAEIIAEANLGTPIDDDTRMHIRRQFAARMEWWRQQIERGFQG